MRGIDARVFLFTPYFGSRQEYEAALHLGVGLTVDNYWELQQWPELFAGQDQEFSAPRSIAIAHHLIKHWLNHS